MNPRYEARIGRRIGQLNAKKPRKASHQVEESVVRDKPDWGRISDAIDINLKYCKREENRLKEEYRQTKRHLKERLGGTKTRIRRFNRIVQKIGRETETQVRHCPSRHK